MKTALYGGAFNPVHNEHINLVLAAKSQLGFDRIIVIPTAVSPHKKGVMTARNKDRLAMCRLAFGGIDGVEVSDYEIKRGGISYSYVTCRHFKKLYPDDDLYFLMGADMLESFPSWKEPEEILKCVTPAVCGRGGAAPLKGSVVAFQKKVKKDLVTFDFVGKKIGSTRLRALAALDEDISGLTSVPVRQYIKNNGLYLLPEIADVKKYLTPERWQHTVRVAIAAAEHARLARVYEFDAIIAAALHDCAKYLSLNAPELSGFVPPKNVPPLVLHQYTGAYVAERTFGIKDEYILNAVRFHCSGRENMGALEKLIYLSDLLEEGRDFDGVEELRKLFDKDIDLCLRSALKHQLDYLNSVGEPVYPLTRRAYDYIIEND